MNETALTLATGAPARRFCTFYLCGAFYGIDALRVQEIVRARPVTRVPLAPPAVVGLMNLRGQIVATIDLRARLRLPLRDGDAPVVVVVQTADGALGLAVDEIGDVIDVDPELCEPPPDTVRGPARPLVVAACKLDGRLLLTLDLDRVLELQTEFEESTVGRAAGATGR